VSIIPYVLKIIQANPTVASSLENANNAIMIKIVPTWDCQNVSIPTIPSFVLAAESIKTAVTTAIVLLLAVFSPTLAFVEDLLAVEQPPTAIHTLVFAVNA